MTCIRCGSGMYHDNHGGIDAWACMICGHRVYPRIKANALCKHCSKPFRALKKIKGPLPAQKCRACGCEYFPRRRGMKFCSNRCAARDAYYRKRPVRYCELCGDTIESNGKRFCSAECRVIKWRTENAERMKAHTRAYYERNKETVNARARQHYLENRELRRAQIRKWGQANREWRRNYMREYYRKNRERIRVRERASYHRRKEAVLAG